MRIIANNKFLDHDDPEFKKHIKIEEIAANLSRINRYGGAVAYNVAQHSLECSVLAEELGCSLVTQAHCLLHDAHEAYTGDVIQSLKHFLPPAYHELTGAIDREIFAVEGLPQPSEITRLTVDKLDAAMAQIEIKAFFPHNEELQSFVRSIDSIAAGLSTFCDRPLRYSSRYELVICMITKLSRYTLDAQTAEHQFLMRYRTIREGLKLP